ncbi:hypothetical protein PI124_g5304 [Phytophthora idaei]|nr:hypothetical protein PI125_g4753 [Phytophthora idaei]KAG3172907.1 hypothetical protein PI126_g1082 [Phytophthora idaei]KAG3250031.1 hypothetical protein PI124_g5304 [Phytophthora idaei]
MKFTALQISSKLIEVTSRGKHGDAMGHWQFFYHSLCILPRPAQEEQPATGKASATPLPQPLLPLAPDHPKLLQQASGSGPLRMPTSDSAQSPALVTKPRPPPSACCSPSRTPSASRKAAPAA